MRECGNEASDLFLNPELSTPKSISYVVRAPLEWPRPGEAPRTVATLLQGREQAPREPPPLPSETPKLLCLWAELLTAGSQNPLANPGL